MQLFGPSSPLFPYVLAFLVPAVLYLALIHKLPFKGDFIIKALPMLTLALATWIFFPAGVVKNLLIMALLFSAGGDISLSFKGEKFFLLGLGNFLVAHVFYIILFAQYSAYTPGTWWVFVALGIFALVMIGLLFPKLGSMKLPVMVYISVIMAMGVYANMWQGPNPDLLLIGAVIFMLSDAMIAIDRFLIPVSWSKYFIMTTYYAAQAMIWTSLVYNL